MPPDVKINISFEYIFSQQGEIQILLLAWNNSFSSYARLEV
jgi:hypothetical protein